MSSWLEKLQEAKVKMEAPVDPWTVRGKVGDDGIERVSTQTLFDHLEVFQRSRGAGACRRLSQVMRDLGWTPVRVRDLTRGGYKEQVRGYCRDTRKVDQGLQARGWLTDQGLGIMERAPAVRCDEILGPRCQRTAPASRGLTVATLLAEGLKGGIQVDTALV